MDDDGIGEARPVVKDRGTNGPNQGPETWQSEGIQRQRSETRRSNLTGTETFWDKEGEEGTTHGCRGWSMKSMPPIHWFFLGHDSWSYSLLQF